MHEEFRELRPPSRVALLGELRVGVEWLALQTGWARLVAKAPRGDGGPVLVVPGFATDDRWTRSLRRFLAEVGHRPHGWGLGRNHGRVDQLLPALCDRTEGLAESSSRPVKLVGWSLGGYLAREVARDRPAAVERVVTLGAPVRGGPKYTASAPMYRRRGYDLDEIERRVAEREKQPLEVPVAAVYSRSDGVVAWRACVDRATAAVEHHEVAASHLGMVASPRVLALVARLLARAPPRDGAVFP